MAAEVARRKRAANALLFVVSLLDEEENFPRLDFKETGEGNISSACEGVRARRPQILPRLFQGIQGSISFSC